MPDAGVHEALRNVRFPHGDCRDAVLGTMLRAAGVPHPEAVLFAELGFSVDPIPHGFRNVSINLRQRDAAADLPVVSGLRVDERRGGDLDDYLEWIQATTAGGLPAVVTVDHWHYEPSQFHRSGHMPHYVLVTGVSGDGFSVFDPYAYSGFDGDVEVDRLRRWVDAGELAGFRYFGFTLSGPHARFDAVSTWLRDTWRATVARNIETMLHGTETQGVKAIVMVADRIQDWVDSAGFAEDVARNRKMPTTSFLEAGAIRRGHARWLRQVAALGVPDLARVADMVHAVGQQWDVVSAVRHAYQVVGAEPAFVARKIAQVPRLLRLIADAERVALEQLAAVAR